MVETNTASKPMSIAERAHVMHRAWRYRLKSEPGGIRFVRKHVRPGQTVLDIGANKGVYSYWLSRQVGRSGRVLAFEPQPKLIAYLHGLKAGFRFTQLEIIGAALSTDAGSHELFRPDSNPIGGATLQPASGAGTSTTVPTVVLDDCLSDRRARPVHFIKCDVEGHELDVFQGGHRMLEEDRPILYFECQDFRHPDGQIGRVFPYLFELGYTGYYFDTNDQLVPIESFDPARHQISHEEIFLDNFAFLPPSS
ncbi:MAG: FkbM family methyltransferase [Planctomycetota bacterium]